LNAISATAIALLMTEVISVQNYIKKWLKMDEWQIIKPFDCSLCLSFWIGLIIGAASTLEVWPSIQVALMAVVCERIMNKAKLFWMP
jgi:hypothetical protein